MGWAFKVLLHILKFAALTITVPKSQAALMASGTWAHLKAPHKIKSAMNQLMKGKGLLCCPKLDAPHIQLQRNRQTPKPMAF